MNKVKKFGNDNGFAVRCNSWHLYNAFAEELKAIGYTHNPDFNDWTREVWSTRDCVWVSDTWNSRYVGPKYSFSRTEDEVFNLEMEWDEALNYAREYLKSRKAEHLALTADYTAKIDREKGIVEVGCQKIPFYKVNELYKMINKI